MVGQALLSVRSARLLQPTARVNEDLYLLYPLVPADSEIGRPVKARGFFVDKYVKCP